VPKFGLRPWIAVVLLTLLPWLANAAGLGKLTVLSSLGQPFNAEIDVVSAQKAEVSSLAARLASPDTYQQANLQYPPGTSGLRFSIEKRPNGQPFIKVTSARPLNEPVVDLLVELAWSSGRISRAYTALIDPPGYGESAATQQEAAAPEARPIAPPVPRDAPVATEQRSAAARVDGRTRATQYGPIKHGETLARVAGAVKPDGVTLEQMLVGLYRSNPEAFVNNMNRMKTGRILKIPAKEDLTSVTPVEATREVRVQAGDWNSYRRKLAEAAGTVPEERGTASGRITARAEDRSAGEPDRDVVRLSKGEPGGGIAGQGKPRGSAQRLRALEEEAIAREKALGEANQRIAELEKTIRDQQRLLALKGVAPAAQPQPAKAAPGESQPAPKPETAAPATPEPAAAAAKDEGVKTPTPAPAASDVAKPAPEPKAKPKAKVVAPPPAPTPDIVDTLLGEPLYLAAGAAVILLGGGGFWLSRRRRNAPIAEEEPVKVSPIFRPAPATTAAEEEKAAEPHVADPALAGDASTDEVDALAEAEVYIAYGRDAQAEQILKEALAASPTRQEVMVKLLEIYAARKDRRAFAEVAEKLQRLTEGRGDNWAKVAAMGAAIDPANALYQATGAPSQAPAEDAVPLDLGLGAPTAGERALAVPIESAAVSEAHADETARTVPEAAQPASDEPPAPMVPEFTLEIPGAETAAAAAPGASAAPAETPPAAPAGDANMIDFKIELPPAEESKPESEAPVQRAPAAAEPGLDFKLDFSDINLQLDDKAPSPAPAGGAKDAHWHDVQQKFDLAKAYEEMGDKDGAREVLQEVVSEGDADQQTQAKKLLEALV